MDKAMESNIQAFHYGVRINKSLKVILNTALITLLIWAEYKYFCLPNNLNYFFVKYNISSNQHIKILLSFFLIITNINVLGKTVKDNYLIKKFFVFWGLVTLSLLISIAFYGEIYVSVYKYINICFLPIGFLAVSLYVKEIGGLGYLSKCITGLNLIAVTIFITQTLVYNRTGQLFLTIKWSHDQVYMRNGAIRVAECMPMVLFSFALSLCEIVNMSHRKKIIHVINTFASFMYLYLSQTRSVILICIIVLAVVFFWGFKANTKFRLLFKTIIIAFLALTFFMGLYQEILGFLTVSRTENSYSARSGAYIYYLGILKNYIFSGLGFVDFKNSSYYSLVHGSAGLFFPSDVGLLGTAINYGLMTGVWYISIIVGSITNYYNSKRTILDFVIPTIFLVTAATLSVLDNERFMLFILLSIFMQYGDEYYFSKLKRRIKLKIKY